MAVAKKAVAKKVVKVSHKSGAGARGGGRQRQGRETCRPSSSFRSLQRSPVSQCPCCRASRASVSRSSDLFSTHLDALRCVLDACAEGTRKKRRFGVESAVGESVKAELFLSLQQRSGARASELRNEKTLLRWPGKPVPHGRACAPFASTSLTGLDYLPALTPRWEERQGSDGKHRNRARGKRPKTSGMPMFERRRRTLTASLSSKKKKKLQAKKPAAKKVAVKKVAAKKAPAKKPAAKSKLEEIGRGRRDAAEAANRFRC